MVRLLRHPCTGFAAGILLLAGLGVLPGTAQIEEACCLDGGLTCVMLPPWDCTAMNGIPAGPGTNCLGDGNNNGIDDACEFSQIPAACCLPDGSCLEFDYNYCLAIGGDPHPFKACDEVICSPIKWSQPPTFQPESPYPDCFWGWDEYSRYGDDSLWIMADDFLCEDSRPITDVHWWGSYWGWDLLEPPADGPSDFHIGIWTNDVDNPPFGRPKDMIWNWLVPRQFLGETFVGCDFHPQFMDTPESCFRYDFFIPEEVWFWQEPGQNIYWISISAVYVDPTARNWGWKTRRPVWNNGAVRILDPTAPVPGDSFINGAPLLVNEQRWDMAFVITTRDEPQTEACCFADGSCLDLLPLDCVAQSGTPMGPGTDCANTDCPVLLEACCFIDGTCLDLLPVDCRVQGGTPMGPGTDCANTICPVLIEACCFADGSCLDLLPTDCTGQGGMPMGAGTNCATTVCPVLLEACCFDDGSCLDLLPVDCRGQGGTTMGAGTDCANTICPVVTEACCFPDGSCLDLFPLECIELRGLPMGPGTDCVNTICPQPDDYYFEFSVDIGSDTELSDPFVDGDEGFDPGDVYRWHGPPVTPPLVPGGRDGIKDDEFIFGIDIFPDPPDPTMPPSTAVPVGEGSPEMYWMYFDLDGHDQIDASLVEFGLQGQPLEMPIFMWYSQCIYWPEFLMISMDDDAGPGWPAFDVPVTAPSPPGYSSYGNTIRRDEILGVTLAPVGLPAPIASVYPIASEAYVHDSLRPNPDDPSDLLDDDVDSLDILWRQNQCYVWYFSPDHEATGALPGATPLDPGDIYEVMFGGGPVAVIDDVNNLGIPDETDIDAFEFVWLNADGATILGVLFSVDDDDPLTSANESGGMDPRMIYVSRLMGNSVPALQEPLFDDIDAITIWSASLEPRPCPGDMDCDGDVDFDDINPFVLALGGPAGYYAQYPWCLWDNGDCDGDGDVDFDDINPFVALIGTVCP